MVIKIDMMNPKCADIFHYMKFVRCCNNKMKIDDLVKM